jgi:predicted nucleic acid-binding protein
LRLFIDTGPFIARYSRADTHHLDSVKTFEKIGRGETSYRKLYTSDYILDEAVTGCRQRTRAHAASVELGSAILSSESIVLLKVDDLALEETWELYKERSEVQLSFTDCTTAVLARRLGIVDLYTYDEKDFRPLGFHAISSL